VTLVEVIHPGINRAALDWTFSRLVIEPVTEVLARHAAALLAETGRHGHQHAIDAVVCATALAAPRPGHRADLRPRRHRGPVRPTSNGDHRLST
jgi:hypothetical protein